MKNEEYKALYFKDIKEKDLKNPFEFDRRGFLKLLGGGIVIFFSLGDAEALQDVTRRAGFLQINPADLTGYLRVGEDGRVSCFTGKIEMGQGVMTSLAQTVSDELDVPMEQIEMVMGDTDLCPWDLGTFGSMTTRFSGPLLREAAAQARAVLIDLAAEQLKIPADRLATKDGVVFDKTDSSGKLTYAELAKGQNIEKKMDSKAAIKKDSELTVIGKSVKRLDALEKVTGKAKYTGDLNFPGMLYAKILRPPTYGAKLKSVDTSAVEKMSNVLLVKDDDFIAVLHKTPDGAEKALSQIKAQYEPMQTLLDDKNIFEHLLSVAPKGKGMAKGGDIAQGEKLSSSVSEATYFNSYVAHAPIENHTAVASMEGTKMTIWASTQTPSLLRQMVAGKLKTSLANVRIITPYVGGGFGGKTENQQALEAAKIAKLTGKTVQVAWSRAEEFFFDAFRPAAVVKVRSGINETGKISFWDYKVYFAGDRGAQNFYAMPNISELSFGGSDPGSPGRAAPGAHPFLTGPWRAPGGNTNTFARESQIDMMAVKAGIDPVEFRLNNIADERMKKVIKIAAEKFGWKPSKAESGRGFGISCSIDSGAYVATMAEVEVNKTTGHVQCKRVVCVQEMGQIINPVGATQQVEGCITMGLGYALTEEVRFKGGEIYDLNFDTYKIPRFSWLPKIDVVLVKDSDLPPQGGGEPAITCMGALIANAIFDATGARLLQLPMTPERVKEMILAFGVCTNFV
ncbi:MAG: xanthine dehydrogenase family protein molybdopterin-binding subunit [Candidatus Schekmanbacteria bacterium]|nr:xanthine dehydrogenase family protein molybdopterin-binding subunit [Candidatus Schekmanbacteria bacterium]